MSKINPKKRGDEELEIVKQKFGYDKENGDVYIKATGKVCESLVGYKYKQANFWHNGKSHCLRVHHIVWYFETGEWPTKTIDHIDGNRLNNHISNLRQCTPRENSTYYFQNRPSTSKYMGVSRDKRAGMWRARARYEGKNVQLKMSVSEEECARAYDEFLVKMGLDPVNFIE